MPATSDNDHERSLSALTEQAQSPGGRAQWARPRFTLSQAAEVTGVSRATIRRYREAGNFPGATKDGQGRWVIPVEDLLAAGLSLAQPAVADTSAVPPVEDVEDREELRVQLARAQAEAAAERAHRQAVERAQSEVIDALRQHLDTAQATIRMIEAAPRPVETKVERVEVPQVVTVPERVEVLVTPRWVPALIAVTVLALLVGAVTVWAGLTGRIGADTAEPTPSPSVSTDPLTQTLTVPSEPTPAQPGTPGPAQTPAPEDEAEPHTPVPIVP